MKNMEAQMMAAQDAVVKRTVLLMESKASQFMKLIQASPCYRILALAA